MESSKEAPTSTTESEKSGTPDYDYYKARRWDEAQIPKRYMEAQLNHDALPASVARFVKGEITGLFLTGIPGSGKTHLACAIGLLLLREKRWVRFIMVPELFQKLRKTFGDNGMRERTTESDVIETYQKTDVLILDDLGAEKHSDFTVDRLYLIIAKREAEMRPTIITSNLTLNEIGEKMHDRLASRIAGWGGTVVMPKVDRRIQGLKG